MLFKIVLLSLVILLSLLLFAQRAVAEPTEIEVELPHIKVFAFSRVLDKWGSEQWSYFEDLIDRESKWKSDAQNPNSTAYGLGQFLNSTWKSVGCIKTSDPYKQIDCTISYVEARYDTPQGAIKFWNKNKFY